MNLESLKALNAAARHTPELTPVVVSEATEGPADILVSRRVAARAKLSNILGALAHTDTETLHLGKDENNVCYKADMTYSWAPRIYSVSPKGDEVTLHTARSISIFGVEGTDTQLVFEGNESYWHNESTPAAHDAIFEVAEKHVADYEETIGMLHQAAWDEALNPTVSNSMRWAYVPQLII